MPTAVALLGLVALAVVVAAAAHRLNTPAPSLLVVAGLAVGFIPGIGVLHVSPDVVLLGILPPLLFAAAQQTSLPDLRRVWRLVAALAVGLVLATAAAVAVVARGIEPRLGIAAAFVLGAILASTDPVAVTALSRHLRLPPRLATVVQTESLFNDATSLVLFQVAVVAVTTAHVTALDALGRFGVLGGGGLLVGLLVGAAGGVVIQRAHVPIVQAGLAVAIPYAAAVAANLARVSPVTAVIVAGLMLARRHPRAAPEAGRRLAESVYAVIVFVFESVVFALIGLQLAGFLRDLSPSERGTALALVAAVTGVLLAVRAATLAAAVGTSRARGRGRGSAREQWAAAAVATWAGARGVVPLAAVLAIPTRTHAGHAVAHRPLLAAVATAVVVVTLVVQGTTLAPLVRRLGVAQQADA